MEATRIIEQLASASGNRLVLTGLAALQYPTVLTRQITFFNSSGNKKDYDLGPYHVLIRRTPAKDISFKTHLLFIAQHLELYAKEVEFLLPILPEIVLSDLKDHDRAWRIFAYLKNQLLKEPIPSSKKMGRRYIDFGDIQSQVVISDKTLHVRDALILPDYFGLKKSWVPKISQMPDLQPLEEALKDSKNYFKSKKLLPIFYSFTRYASRLESAASAKIEGYETALEEPALQSRIQEKMRSHPSLKAHLNMNHLHRDLIHLSKEPLSLDLLLTVQQAIVKDTWKNESEKIDKTLGQLRTFDEVIVDRGGMHEENIIYTAPRHQDVKTLLEELIDFYHKSRKSLHPLNLAAIFKCQLVIIHPFGDGNGRLARWCFLSILIREKLIESIHQAPISQIFLQEKNRYYDALLQLDAPVLKHTTYSIDQTTQRYQVDYENVDLYRHLDYAPWLAYIHDAFIRALFFSQQEHRVFEKVQKIYSDFEKKIRKKLEPNQQHEISRAIDIGLKKEWGKKTEKRLENNGFDLEEIRILKEALSFSSSKNTIL